MTEMVSSPTWLNLSKLGDMQRHALLFSFIPQGDDGIGSAKIDR
jgi:hypothetical protein